MVYPTTPTKLYRVYSMTSTSASTEHNKNNKYCTISCRVWYIYQIGINKVLVTSITNNSNDYIVFNSTRRCGLNTLEHSQSSDDNNVLAHRPGTDARVKGVVSF